jgi:phosphomecalonate degydratase large subunit
MHLTLVEHAMLAGEQGPATRKAMEILVTLGTIYGAETMLPVSSVQVAGVSYDNLGEAGLQFLREMADGGGKAHVLATLNPAGMDLENWRALGISPDFAQNQLRVIQAFARMNIVTTCTCTPYLSGNLPHFGEHIAWAESSAVCFANSVLGARTNREGGPSALAAALTGRTPAYGLHLEKNRHPGLTVEVEAGLREAYHYGALGKAIGRALESAGEKTVPFIFGMEKASLEDLKSFCASLATYAGSGLFHAKGVTPEAGMVTPPHAAIRITQSDLDVEIASLNDEIYHQADFVSLGCPHLSIKEIARLAELLRGRKVAKEFWITTSRPVKHIADHMGYSQLIEESGAKFAVDTCCVVAPIEGRFKVIATDSAKACYYAHAKNKFGTVFASFEDVVREALAP